ncbi:DNA polymerase domain-containing protein [Methanobacterium formicicum]|uniref:DNA-directed DNA polymerase n=1 Tax=Methanobacterium formicicum (strain DSM 3637 / PP1) TaxID=1204725 RepID=K2RBG3_METFP|nr:DNA polymerase domain-containing protein [Methanobacterium formicicum]EKF85654.1 DNA-directed DNA polymerase [Methanobacterium formicicum DSM 3637]
MHESIKKNVDQFLLSVNHELPHGMELEFEGFYERGFFVTKKRYALIQDDKIVVKGLELVRRDWAPVAKKTQEKVMMAILKDASPDKAAKIIKEIVEEIKNGKTPLEDLVIHTQLTKNPDKYKQMAPHVLAAKKAIARGRKVGRGSIIRYIVVKGKGPISQRAEPLEDVDVANYDPNYYIENQVLPAVSRIIDSLGYSHEEIVHQEKQTSLDAFFN